ncbi:MAG: hypothetical protein VKK59_01750 [Vampirovibrionales bacterium]|nr:hypothetical protein [Vampirovibrionales bacterium]
MVSSRILTLEKPVQKNNHALSYHYSMSHAAQWLGLSRGGVLRLLRIFWLRLDGDGFPVLDSWRVPERAFKREAEGRTMNIQPEWTQHTVGFFSKPAYLSNQMRSSAGQTPILRVYSSADSPSQPNNNNIISTQSTHTEERHSCFRPEALQLLWLLKSGLARGDSLSVLRQVLAQQAILFPKAHRSPEAFRTMFASKPFELSAAIQTDDHRVAAASSQAISGKSLLDDADMNFLDSLTPTYQQNAWLLPDMTPLTSASSYESLRVQNNRAIPKSDPNNDRVGGSSGEIADSNHKVAFGFNKLPEDETTVSMFGWLLKRLRLQQADATDNETVLKDNTAPSIVFDASQQTPDALKANAATGAQQQSWSAQHLKSEAQRVRNAFING